MEINYEKVVNKEIVALRKQEMYSQEGLKKASFLKTKKCVCGDCEECLKDFTYFLHIFSNDQSVPDISAKSWCIWKKSEISLI